MTGYQIIAVIGALFMAFLICYAAYKSGDKILGEDRPPKKKWHL